MVRLTASTAAASGTDRNGSSMHECACVKRQTGDSSSHLLLTCSEEWGGMPPNHCNHVND